MNQRIDLMRAREIVREVGGKNLMERLERSEDPTIYLLTPVSAEKREELNQAIKAIRQAHGRA